MNKNVSYEKFVVLLLILGLAAGCATKKVAKKRPAVKPLKYEVLDTRAEAKDAVKSRNQTQLPVVLEQDEKQIVDLLTRYSKEAFLKPKTLAQGKASRLEPFFVSELRERAAEDWENLSLGEEAAVIQRVSRSTGKVTRLWVFYDEGPTPTLSAVDLSLRADYELSDGGKAKLTISGSFALEPDQGDDWKISGYRAKFDLRSTEKDRAWNVAAGKFLSSSY